jgi:CubicO group peptidase (beta-lactamase class C family)
LGWHTDPEYGPFDLNNTLANVEPDFVKVPGGLKLRDALRMRGGLVEDDFGPSKLHKHTLDKKDMTFLEAINAFARRKQSAKPGETFLYSNMTAAILGTALQARLQENDSSGGPKTIDKALEQWVWHPFRMGGSARWKTDKSGSPSPYCCFYMRAYDLAKFGEFVLRELKPPGARRQKWLIDASRYEGGSVKPQCFSQGEPFLLGYGYQWWVFKNTDLGFTGIGTGGQFLHIIPKSNMVIVQFSSVENDDLETFMCDSFSAHKLIQDFLDRP